MGLWNRATPPPKADIEHLLAQGFDGYEIGAHYKVNQSVIWKWMKQYDIASPRSRFRKTSGQTTGYLCRCGETDPALFTATCPYRCRKCGAVKSKERRQRMKRVITTVMGGECRNCGYKAAIASLTLHHVGIGKDPDANRITAWPWAKVLSELLKCVLLCANCHSGHHSGEIDLPNLTPGPLVSTQDAVNALALSHGERRIFIADPTKARRPSTIQ